MGCGRWQGRKRDSGASAIEYASPVLVATAIITGLPALSFSKLDANGKPYLYAMYPDPVKALNPP